MHVLDWALLLLVFAAMGIGLVARMKTGLDD